MSYRDSMSTLDLAEVLAGRIPSPQDIEDLVVAAIRADVPGLLSSALASQQYSSQAQQLLKKQATRIAATNANALNHFSKVACALDQASVPFLLLKGAALNLMLYDRLDLRAMTDIDILIHPHHANRADEALRDAGCQAGRDLLTEDFYPAYYYEKEYHLPEATGFRVDVHVRPFRPLRFMQTLPADALWSDPMIVRYQQEQWRCPSLEDLFIHLVVHSAVHGDARLIWLYDIYLFLQREAENVDWHLVKQRVNAWSLTFAFQSTLEVVTSRFGCELPADLKAILSGPVCWQDRVVLKQAPRDEHHPIAHIVLNLMTTQGMRFRLGYLSAVLLPGARHMSEVYPWRHPGWLICAHLWRWMRSVLRPLRLVK